MNCWYNLGLIKFNPTRPSRTFTPKRFWNATSPINLGYSFTVTCIIHVKHTQLHKSRIIWEKNIVVRYRIVVIHILITIILAHLIIILMKTVGIWYLKDLNQIIFFWRLTDCHCNSLLTVWLNRFFHTQYYTTH